MIATQTAAQLYLVHDAGQRDLPADLAHDLRGLLTVISAHGPPFPAADALEQGRRRRDMCHLCTIKTARRAGTWRTGGCDAEMWLWWAPPWPRSRSQTEEHDRPFPGHRPKPRVCSRVR